MGNLCGTHQTSSFKSISYPTANSSLLRRSFRPNDSMALKALFEPGGFLPKPSENDSSKFSGLSSLFKSSTSNKLKKSSMASQINQKVPTENGLLSAPAVLMPQSSTWQVSESVQTPLSIGGVHSVHTEQFWSFLPGQGAAVSRIERERRIEENPREIRGRKVGDVARWLERQTNMDTSHPNDMPAGSPLISLQPAPSLQSDHLSSEPFPSIGGTSQASPAIDEDEHMKYRPPRTVYLFY